MAVEVALVSDHGHSCSSSAVVGEVLAVYQVVVTGGGTSGVPLWMPSLSSVHKGISNWWGWGGGGGMYLLDQTAAGVWMEEENGLHINILAIKVVHLALATFRDWIM